MKFTIILLALSTIFYNNNALGHSCYNQPNIVLIMADDMGWNDISLHGSNQILTPNIDALGLYGITLNRHYAPSMCTPSRSALLTGKYPIRTGMFHFVIPSDEPWGLPLSEKTLPQYLLEAGYTTHLIGKWHLGFFKKEYNPIQRGFDSFFGYLGPYIDYFDHSLIMLNRQYARGYDMRHNETVDYSTKGKYATDLFTDAAVRKIKTHDQKRPLFLLLNHLAPHTANEDFPLQAPSAEVNKFNYINNIKRRTYAAMMSKLDKGVGRVVKALKDNGMMENTVIVFYSDNGAPTIGQHANSGSNYPFRGQKDSPWEGGVRTAATIFSPLLKRRQRVSNQLIHVTDWLPTFANLAGLNIDTTTLDGHDIWRALSYNEESPRKEIIHNIDDIDKYASYMRGEYKYIEGTRHGGDYDTWLGEVPLDNPITTSGVDYATAVKTSDAGKALVSYALFYPKDASRFDDILERDTKSDTGHGLSAEFIRELREDATVRCYPPLTPLPKPCNPTVAPCLFNIIEDPCEYNNIANERPKLTNKMKNLVNLYRSIVEPARNQPSDPNCDPANFGGIWTWWQ